MSAPTCRACDGCGREMYTERVSLDGYALGDVEDACSACHGSGVEPCILCDAPSVALYRLDPLCGACLDEAIVEDALMAGTAKVEREGEWIVVKVRAPAKEEAA